MSEEAKKPEPIQVQEGRICKNCVWSKEFESYSRRIECRKREPMIGTIMLSTDSYNEKSREGTWPSVEPSDWCGAFNSKIPAFVSEPVKEAPVVTP